MATRSPNLQFPRMSHGSASFISPAQSCISVEYGWWRSGRVRIESPLSPACPISPPPADGPLHGYGIIAAVEDRTRGEVTIGPEAPHGSIPRILERGFLKKVPEGVESAPTLGRTTSPLLRLHPTGTRGRPGGAGGPCRVGQERAGEAVARGGVPSWSESSPPFAAVSQSILLAPGDPAFDGGRSEPGIGTPTSGHLRTDLLPSWHPVPPQPAGCRAAR
jgi:hypothetical protein